MSSSSRHVVLILAGVLLPLCALSAAPPRLLGLEDMSCTAWKATKGDPERREPYLQWVRGFLSGHNYASQSRQVGEVSAAAVALYVDRYCAEHAAATVATAAMRMSDEYSGRNAPITR
ncbi:hypothetical protein [Denitratisoma oestradiolicum]|nr:hypothetical protein [Denitratisoma oestradiolicum]